MEYVLAKKINHEAQSRLDRSRASAILDERPTIYSLKHAWKLFYDGKISREDVEWCRKHEAMLREDPKKIGGHKSRR